MFRFIKNKIKNKKLLNFSLLTGVVLLTAFLCIYPMFREGSLNKLLRSMFVEHIGNEEEYPAVLSKNDSVVKDDGTEVADIISMLNSDKDKWGSQISIPIVQNQKVITSKGGAAETSFGEKTRLVLLGYIPDMYEYSDLVFGISAEEAYENGDETIKQAIGKGAYPCVISQKCMDSFNLVIGEELEYKPNAYDDSETVKFIVTGIIEEKTEDKFFYHKPLSDYYDTLFLSEKDFNSVIKSCPAKTIEYTNSVMIDYSVIEASDAKAVSDRLKTITEADEKIECNFSATLDSYCEQESAVSVILIAFELPIVSLLLLFLYMISSRILEMETTEIAMLKSRGIKRAKIIKLYVMQSSLIAFAGCIIGLPAGFGMCKLAASTDAFLSFTMKDISIYKPTPMMLVFALGAFALSVLFMTLPVVVISKLTITERKTLRLTANSKPVWEKVFLDIILLGISGYLLFNYYRQQDVMAADIISGGAIDPVIFIDSSLFILACGLLVLRLSGYLVRLIYKIGKKRWKPASYIAFLQIIRGAKKQGFILVFLIMTIAMGIFNSNLARTVNENVENRTTYNDGADLRIEERWKMTVKKADSDYIWSYKEPDFERFSDLGAVSKTRVIIDENTDILVNKKVEKGNTLMAINTKEFGETAILSGELNDRHWFEYLNALAKVPAGCLISRNLATKYELKEGDKITYSRYSPLDKKVTYISAELVVCGVVDAFPGFESTYYELSEGGSLEEKQRFLVVANYTNIVNKCHQTPYSVWMKLPPQADASTIIDAINQKGLILKDTINLSEDIKNKQDSAMIQITNGMFSVGFVISLLICAVGFLIYWILTIRERELFYGIYRAMGMSMREIVKMLMTEQIFSSFLAVLSGFGVGMLTTVLFTKLLATVYLPQKHNLPIEMVIKGSDAVKIVAIICVTFLLCFIVMRRIIRNMNIAKALKMGED